MTSVIAFYSQRLFRSFVLVSFLWMTLLPTLVFAELERAKPDPVFIETQNTIRYAHFNVGVKKFERPRSPTSVADSDFDLDLDSIQKPAPAQLRLPIDEIGNETQHEIDDANITDSGVKPAITECALAWTEFGLNLFRHNSGDLIISKNKELAHLFDPSVPLQIDNDHGSIIFDDDFGFDFLVLNGKDIVLKRDVSIKNLYLFIEGTILNRAFLSVSTLYMNGVHQTTETVLTHPKFVNEGHLAGLTPAEIKGNVAFYNTPTGTVGGRALSEVTLDESPSPVHTKYDQTPVEPHDYPIHEPNRQNRQTPLPPFEPEIRDLHQEKFLDSLGLKDAPAASPIEASTSNALHPAQLAPAALELNLNLLHERIMSIRDNACGFYSLGFEDKAGATVRWQGVDLLLQHADNVAIRRILAHEISDELLSNRSTNQELQALLTTPEARSCYQNLIKSRAEHTEAIKNANKQLQLDRDLTNHGLIKLLKTCREIDAPVLKRVQNTMKRLAAAKANIQEWAGSKEAFQHYVTHVIGQPNRMLTSVGDINSPEKMPGSLDALAECLGVNLNVYLKDFEDPSELHLAHSHQNGHQTTIDLVHVVYNSKDPRAKPNHFNRLEPKEPGKSSLTQPIRRLEEARATRNAQDSKEFSIEPQRNVLPTKTLVEQPLDPSKRTTFALGRPIVNEGTMDFAEAVVFDQQTLINTHILKSASTLQGTLNGLDNTGTLQAKGGFDLTVEQFHNGQEGQIQGSGQITIITPRALEAINNGVIDTGALTLQIDGRFSNNHIVQTAEILETQGMGTFHQKGILTSPHVLLNNAHIEIEQNLNQPQLKFMCGAAVKTFINRNDKTLHTQTLSFAPSTAATAKAVNQGTIRTSVFDNGAPHFSNQESLTADHWQQTGQTFTNEAGATLDVAHSTTFAATHVINAGDITLNEQVTGSVDHFTNTGGLMIHRKATLTGKSFSNTKTLRAQRLFDWTGQSFTTASTSNMHTQKLNIHLTGSNPLIFEGAVTNDQGATLHGSSITNKASFKTETGSTTLTGTNTLDNEASFDVDDLTYEGNTLTNTTAKSSFKAKRYSRNTKLDALTNEGSFIIETGGFEAGKITNKKTLELKGGLYRCEALDNAEGTAIIDQFSLTNLSPTLDGTLVIERFIPGFKTYTHITINGTTTLNSGDFHTETLTLKGTLTLGKGHYRIDKLVGEAQS